MCSDYYICDKTYQIDLLNTILWIHIGFHVSSVYLELLLKLNMLFFYKTIYTRSNQSSYKIIII